VTPEGPSNPCHSGILGFSGDDFFWVLIGVLHLSQKHAIGKERGGFAKALPTSPQRRRLLLETCTDLEQDISAPPRLAGAIHGPHIRPCHRHRAATAPAFPCRDVAMELGSGSHNAPSFIPRTLFVPVLPPSRLPASHGHFVFSAPPSEISLLDI